MARDMTAARLPAGTYYRCVTTERPTELDFRSHAAKGLRPPHDDPDLLRRWGGVSVFTTAAQARANLERARPRARARIGEWIAELQMPEGTAVTCEGPDYKGHWDLYNARPDLLLSYVTSVVHYTSVAA